MIQGNEMTNRSRLECLRVKRMHLSCSIALHLAIYLLHRILSSAVFFPIQHPHQHHHDDRIVLNCIHISVYQNFSLIFFWWWWFRLLKNYINVVVLHYNQLKKNRTDACLSVIQKLVLFLFMECFFSCIHGLNTHTFYHHIAHKY